MAACPSPHPHAAEQLRGLQGEHPGRPSLVSMTVTDEASNQVSALASRYGVFCFRPDGMCLWRWHDMMTTAAAGRGPGQGSRIDQNACHGYCQGVGWGQHKTRATAHLSHAAAEGLSGEHGHPDLLLNVPGILHTPDGVAPGTNTGRGSPQKAQLVQESVACRCALAVSQLLIQHDQQVGHSLNASALLRRDGSTSGTSIGYLPSTLSAPILVSKARHSSTGCVRTPRSSIIDSPCAADICCTTGPLARLERCRAFVPLLINAAKVSGASGSVRAGEHVPYMWPWYKLFAGL